MIKGDYFFNGRMDMEVTDEKSPFLCFIFRHESPLFKSTCLTMSSFIPPFIRTLVIGV